uniref:BRI1 kinase inhibitor 1 n=1 Tax=Aegilops tauschii TaxID=37682 RepID=M8C1I9_AEGTA
MASLRVHPQSNTHPPVVATSNDGVLPLDILYDIPLCLPTELICRFRAVWRSWRSMLCHPDFIADARDPGPLLAVGRRPFFPGLGGAWRPGEGRDDTAGKAEEDRKKVKGKRGPLEVGQRVKKYMASLVEQLLASFSRHGERDRRGQRRRPHTFSVNGPGAAATMERERWRQRRGHLSSAPASLRASPVNSGHLSVGGSLVKVSTSSEESTMEELQSAIQAAIAHCKNSIAVAKQ